MSRTYHHRQPWASLGNAARALGTDDMAAVRKGYLVSTVRDYDGYPKLTRQALFSGARPGERKALQREFNRRDRRAARRALWGRAEPAPVPRRCVNEEL
ncbi:hypothetical protein [Streptomyces niveus]|uniref:hypothetical protein n=1 Tax=Streptomyces niveus TaxID=193462 RepID=UPI003426AF17